MRPACCKGGRLVIERAQQLREVREAAGLSLADVAQRLRLSAKHLEALEVAEWDRLPGAAFTRAALRSYARLLSVEVDALLAQLPAANSPDLLRPAPSLEARMPRRENGLGFRSGSAGRTVRWVVLGLVVLGVGAALRVWPEALSSLRDSVRARYLHVTAPGETAAPSTEAAAAPLQAASPPAPTDPVPPMTDQVSKPAEPVAPLAQTPLPGADKVPVPETPGSAVSWPQKLVVTTRKDSWLEVRDPNERVVYMGLVRPSSPLTLELRSPASYTVGNAAGTVLEFAGQTVNLAATTQPGTNIAKGSLP